MFKAMHQVAEDGNAFSHRIQLVDPQGVPLVTGEWATYRAIAEVSYEGRTFIATTQYFGGALFPTETVLEVTVVKNKVDE